MTKSKRESIPSWLRRINVATLKEVDKTSSRHSTDWSNGKWKKRVLINYKWMYEKHFKNPILMSMNHSVGIKIINPIETEYFRVYAILTPWMLDCIVEFMIDLNKTQINIAEKKLHITQVSPLTNEKTRWVMAGTSLVDRYTKKKAIDVGTHWSNNLLYDAFRIVHCDLHIKR